MMNLIKSYHFFVNDVNAEKATALQLINYREMTQDTLTFIWLDLSVMKKNYQ